jgi:hypothetical protein
MLGQRDLRRPSAFGAAPLKPAGPRRRSRPASIRLVFGVSGRPHWTTRASQRGRLGYNLRL